MSGLRQALIAVAAFAGGAVVADLAGAANLGTALGVGQITFAIAVVYLLREGIARAPLPPAAPACPRCA